MIVITGMFRSGTTLLSRILNAHQSISMCYDTYLPVFQSFRMALARQMDIEIHSNVERVDQYFYPVIDYYFNQHQIRLLQSLMQTSFEIRIDHQELVILREMVHQYGERFCPEPSRNFARIRAGTYSELLRSILIQSNASLADGVQPVLAGLKDAWVDEYIPSLINSFPDIKIIQIVRDPRAVCASKNYGPQTKPYSWLFLARQWRRYGFMYWLLGKRYKKNLLQIKFEELIENPKESIDRICQFVGVKVQIAMYDPTAYIDGRNMPWLQNSSFKSKEKFFNRASLSHWETALDPKVVAFIEALCWPEMRMCGYTPIFSPCTTSFECAIEGFRDISHQELSPWIKSHTLCREDHRQMHLRDEATRNSLIWSAQPVTRDIIGSFLSEQFFTDFRATLSPLE